MNFNLNNVKFNKYVTNKDDFWSAEIYAKFYDQEIGKIEQVGRILYFLDNDLIRLERIIVNQKYQHNGIGSKLISMMFDDCKQLGISKIDGLYAPDDEKQARAFYTKFGFEIQEDILVDRLFKNIDLEGEAEG